ncbi:MAG: sulfate adenylyltransferase small subunit, partial [Candidatus Nanopelagicales bacterium]
MIVTSAAPATVSEDDVLDALEAEAIHVYREVAGAFRRPVLLYSIGKDSSVL